MRRSARGHQLTGRTLRVLRDAGLEKSLRAIELYGESFPPQLGPGS